MVSKNVPQVKPRSTGMIYKFIKKEDQFIHTFCEGELLYRLGFNPTDVIGKSLNDFFPMDYALSKIDYYHKAWNGEFIEYEFKNDEVNYLGHLRPVFEKGKVIEVIGTCVDITENKKMEDEVRLKEKLSQTVLETMSEAIFTLGSNGKITHLNEHVERILGIKTGTFDESTLNQLGIEFLAEDGTPLSYSALPGIVTQTKGIPLHNVIYGVKYKKDQVTKWFSVNSKPLKVNEKDHQTALVSFTDITLQKEQELKLVEAYAYQKNLINKLDSGIVATDQHGKITLMNTKFYEMLDLKGDMASYIGRSASGFFLPFQ